MLSHPIDRVIFARGTRDELIFKWRLLDFMGVSVRLHQLVRSDSDRDIHDHPWWNCSVVLDGALNEVVEAKVLYGGGLYHQGTKALRREAGDVIFRPAKGRHKILLDSRVKFWDGLPVKVSKEKVVTLFIHGRDKRVWGFWDELGYFTPNEENRL
jgi:hypothetical protein